MLREDIKKAVEKVIKQLQQGGIFPDFEMSEIEVFHPENRNYGDYSTNIAFQLAKTIKKSPLEVGDLICSKVKGFESNCTTGFINFFIPKEYLQMQVGEIIKQKEKFGDLKIGKGQKVNVEFISANPTGPLHIGNGRGGYCGDTLANVLKKAGYNAKREYYINDRGRQIKILKDTLEGKGGYKNEYTDELIKEGEKDEKRAVEFIVGKIKKTTERMGIKFDKWFYETSLYDKETNEILSFLGKNNLTEKKEGAIWFKSTKFGDDKNRVLVRTEEKITHEKETYLLSDFAYLKDKFERGFKSLIIFLGAEHHGYVPRLKAAVEALGYDKGQLKPIVFQLVKLIKEGREVRMSKRAGVYVAIDDVLDEIGEGDDVKGRDVSRFFFLSKTTGTHLDFDIDLAKEESEKNPVYYAQYAHARICSILKKAKSGKKKAKSDLKLLTHKSELKLIKELIRLPEIVEDTAKDYQTQRLPQYAVDMAMAFHAFYRDCKVISGDKSLEQARIFLISAVKIVLENTLELMGISAPAKM